MHKIGKLTGASDDKIARILSELLEESESESLVQEQDYDRTEATEYYNSEASADEDSSTYAENEALRLTDLPFEYRQIANGPYERVLAFNNDEHIVLKNPPQLPKKLSPLDVPKLLQDLHDAGPAHWPYFSSRGPLTDIFGNVLRGTRVETTFPVDPLLIPAQETFPKPQVFPYDQPPLDEAATKGNGYSKQAYFLNASDSFVTVGPSLPKIARVGNSAQFWVGSIGVIAQGRGRFKGVKGVTTYVGSGFLKRWPPPEAFSEQIAILAQGFTALIGTYVKVVLRG